MFTSTSLPNDVTVLSRYGVTITLFKPSIDELFAKRHHPIFHAVFQDKFQQAYQDKFQQAYSVASLKEGALLNAFAHEMARQYLQYEGAEKRLINLYPVISEIGAAVWGIKA